MTTYDASSVSDAVIAFRKPITLQQGRGLRDNPIAIAEGATGAPRVQGAALSIFGGTSTSTGTSTPATYTGIGRANQFQIKGRSTLTGISTNTNLRVEFSSDNGATWSSPQNLQIIGSTLTGGTDNSIYDLFINTETGAWWAMGVLINDAGSSSSQIDSVGTLTVPTDVDAFRLSHTNVNASGRFHLFVVGGRA